MKKKEYILICGLLIIVIVLYFYFRKTSKRRRKKTNLYNRYTETKISAKPSSKNMTDTITYLYLYFYPYLMIYRSLLITSSFTGHSIVLPNTVIKYTDAVNKNSLLFTTPNSQLLFGFIWLNIEKSPAYMTVPAIPTGRYFNIQIVDCMNQVIGYQGIRNVGITGGNYIIMKNNVRELFPDASENVRRTYTSTTNLVLCIITIQLLDINDMNLASSFLLSFGVTCPTPDRFVGSLFTRRDRVNPNSILGVDYRKHVKYGVDNGWFVPPQNIVKLLKDTESATAEETDNGVKAAHLLIREKMAELTDYSDPELQKIFYIGNWKMGEGKYSGSFPNVPQTNKFHSSISSKSSNPLLPNKRYTNYINSVLIRALSVRLGTFGSIPEDSIYLYTFFDNDGNPLNGDYNYQIIIENVPPVEAFWLMNIYSADHSQFIFPSESSNFSISSLNVTTNTDGSIQIYIWPMRPMNLAGESYNYLPCTFGKPFFLFLGLYLPMVEQIYKWTPPIVNRMGKALSLPSIPFHPRR